MNKNDELAEQFETHRRHLRAVAYRMLGSAVEADDAVQETWLRLNRSDAGGVDNLRSWLTTVVARVCLDTLRSRRTRPEDPVGTQLPEPRLNHAGGLDPEGEAVLADSVGLALLVVLETLTPAERLAFVLHDLFAVPYDEIAPIVERTPAAARQLASRARRRIQGADPATGSDSAPGRPRQRQIVQAFLDASRNGDFTALLALLDPDVVLRVDASAVALGATRQFCGAAVVAGQARLHSGRARYTEIVLVDGGFGLAVAPGGRLFGVLKFTIAAERVIELELVADPERLQALDLVLLAD